MSYSVVTERACIGLANQLILEFGLPIPRVQHMSEIASTIFVSLFQALCGYLPTGVLEHPQTREEEVRNVQVLIDTLSSTFLHLPLTHIKGRNVIDMDAVSVYNLLEIFQAYAKHTSMSQQIASSSSPSTTSPTTTADALDQHSRVNSVSSPNTPTWSNCFSEDIPSSLSPTSILSPRAPKIPSFSGKRLHGSPCMGSKHKTEASANNQSMVVTPGTWADELRATSSKPYRFCHRPTKGVASICHACNTDHVTFGDSPTSPSDGSLCERCKQLCQKSPRDGWLRHHVRSPFKKLRVSPQKEDVCCKNYSDYIELDPRITTRGQKAARGIAAPSTKRTRTSVLREVPNQELEHYVCVNCRTPVPRQGKENYIIHQLSETAAPSLPKQSCRGSSFLHDSTLCASCKLSLSQQGKQKQYSEPVLSPRKNSPLRNFGHFDNDSSILHHCSKVQVSPLMKTKLNCVDPYNVSERASQSIRESLKSKWTPHNSKKNWSFPTEGNVCSPRDNSYSSTSPSSHIEDNAAVRYHSGTYGHSHSRVECMPFVPSLKLDSPQDTDEGPIRLRFHGSSKQVQFGQYPKDYLLEPAESKIPAKIPSHVIAPTALYKCRSQPIRNETSSKRKYQSKIELSTKKMSGSIPQAATTSPRRQRYQSKSPSPRETVLIRHRTKNRVPKSQCETHPGNKRQRSADVGDGVSWKMRSAARQRAGSSRSFAWKEGIVKCAATYGFHVPSSDEPTIVKNQDPNAGVTHTAAQQDMLQYLQQKFPYLAVPQSSIENLRMRYLQDMKRMANLYLNGYADKAASLESYNLLKRQIQLQNIMSRDLAACQRKNDLQVHQYRWQKLQSMSHDQRIQSVRIKHYYEDHQLAQRSKMLRQRSKEEMLFKELYEEGMVALHKELREIKKNVKEDLTQFRNEHHGKLEELHNYYKVQLDLLADTVASQKNNLEDQELVLKRLQREFRQKLRESLLEAQDQILRQDEDDFHFREQDKNCVKNKFRKS